MKVKSSIEKKLLLGILHRKGYKIFEDYEKSLDENESYSLSDDESRYSHISRRSISPANARGGIQFPQAKQVAINVKNLESPDRAPIVIQKSKPKPLDAHISEEDRVSSNSEPIPF